MIKFLHCADLHLDSPLTALDITRSEARRNELRAAFTSLTMSAKLNGVDFLLISGDLFDGEFVSRDTVELICNEFEAIPDCRIVIAPGNHDPYSPSSYYRRGEFPKNVFIFDSPEVTFFDFPEKNTTVYGYAFTADSLGQSPISEFRVNDPSRINLLVAHGELDSPNSPYCPLSSDELSRCGFDYIALGHRHTYTEPKKLGGGYAAYSGCLEGRGFDECGIKGAIMAAVEKNPELQFASKFVRFCKRHFETERLDVSGAKSNADVLDALTELINEKHYNEDTALRVKLVGEVSDSCRISTDFLHDKLARLFMLELADGTVPLLDKEKLCADMTIRGEYYRSLMPMLESEDEALREVAATALRCGLAALAGNDFTEI